MYVNVPVCTPQQWLIGLQLQQIVVLFHKCLQWRTGSAVFCTVTLNVSASFANTFERHIYIIEKQSEVLRLEEAILDKITISRQLRLFCSLMILVFSSFAHFTTSLFKV